MKHKTSSRCFGSYAARKIAVELKLFISMFMGLPALGLRCVCENSHRSPAGKPTPCLADVF